MIKFFKTQGIDEPTETTKKAFDKQSIFANFDNFYHAMGQFTFNMENKLNIITTCLNKNKILYKLLN